MRAVFDTNVFVAATLSGNPASPTRELLERWLRGEFVLLVSRALADEVLEKLAAYPIDQGKITDLLARLERLAEWVEVPAEAVEQVLPDADDDVVLACAVQGHATHLITYDPHFDKLGGEYRGIRILKALPFLWAVRGDEPPTA